MGNAGEGSLATLPARPTGRRRMLRSYPARVKDVFAAARHEVYDVFVPSRAHRRAIALAIRELHVVRDIPIAQVTRSQVSPTALALARALGITCTPIDQPPSPPPAPTQAEPTPAASPDPQPPPGPSPAES